MNGDYLKEAVLSVLIVIDGYLKDVLIVKWMVVTLRMMYSLYSGNWKLPKDNVLSVQ